ncbi:MAG: hypothetical protein KJ799_04950 [Bacteroidetes bacterium]|nr:hypothetical protein [Bacteroidota bacterium]MBU1677944.1 hypothetical protein [Bacteroidota bacterium]MBU2506055.1 hypothetical protein [Bacteroidota bacterium]
MKKKIIVLLLAGLFLLSCQDSSVEPENQFVQIFFKYGIKNELNTFENTYQKDLFLDGVIKIKFWLTADEQNKILEKAYSVNYFSMPDTFKVSPWDSIYIYTSPDSSEQILRIKYQDKEKTTIWTYPLVENMSQFKDLLELQQFIISIIESKPEYKKLPDHRGGYM